MTKKEDHIVAEDPLLEGDEEYHSSEDEDFNPNASSHNTKNHIIGNSDSDDSSSESDDGEEQITTDTVSASKSHAAPSKHKKKRSASDIEVDNSGDEAVVKRGKHKKGSSVSKLDEDYDDDEGGEGGVIKTRAQRAREKLQQAPIVSTKGATVDVDALWKSLNAPEPPPQSRHTSTQPTTVDTPSLNPAINKNDAKLSKMSEYKGEANGEGLGTSIIPAGDGMVIIKRTYKFAGEVVTEEKTVSANSYEARAHTSSTTPTNPSSLRNNENNPKQKPLRRPIKRKSKFDVDAASIKVPTKLTTLEKSRLDWAGYVDKAGIGDELDKQKKGGAGYLDRKDFLGRVEHRTNEFGKGR